MKRYIFHDAFPHYLMIAVVVLVIAFCGANVLYGIEENKEENVKHLIEQEGFHDVHVEGYWDSPSVFFTCNKLFSIKRKFIARDKNGMSVSGKICGGGIFLKTRVDTEKME